ncbi:hypothetical protein EV283_0475 [Sphingomonas sp. BK036]|uniref:hypothetical protein n=1 Tax=Sphingomonas sp. BK036 TaxID=2512122 RepID=UPI001028B52B|nr:hypothetical protein [Sphingomonas sp. BK036]RZT56424.1 hypothetical protein EV283_0475 [Sphingomonas sp. BK036]
MASNLDERLKHLRQLEEAARERDARERLKGGSGDGTSGGMTDDWKESVNGQLKQLHDDVRRLTGWIIAGAITPFVAIIGLYVFTSLKSDNVGNRIVAVESRMTALQVEQAKQGGKLDLLLERKAARTTQ